MKNNGIGLVLGQNAVGKSWFLRKLMKLFPQDYDIVSGSKLYLNLIDEEHEHSDLVKFSGKIIIHDHPWCKGALYHSHAKKNNIVIFPDRIEAVPYNIRKNTIPFTIHNQRHVVQMRMKLCRLLNESSGKKPTIVELALGKNINHFRKDYNTALVDVSSNELMYGLSSGMYENAWMNNVEWIVVVLASSIRRFILNYEYKNIQGKDIGLEESPAKNQQALNLYGASDFIGSDLEKLFMTLRIPIFILENKTDLQMEKDSRKLIKRISRITSSSDLTSQQFRHIL